MQRESVRYGALGGLAGAMAMYLLDPQVGHRRRRRLRDRGRALARRSWRGGVRLERHAHSSLYGRVMAVRHRRERPKLYDDVTLTHKVESLLYRNSWAPKGRINMNACEAVVTLRGTVDDAETIDRIVECVRDIQGVRGIDNRLHLPDLPPPQHDTRPRIRARHGQ